MCFVFEIIVSELPPNFGNTSAMLSFFLKFGKFNIDFKNAEKNRGKPFVFEIIEFELVAINCIY